MSTGSKYGRNTGGRRHRASRAQSLWSSGRYMTPPHPAKPLNEFASMSNPLSIRGCFWHAPARNPDFL